MEEINDLYEVKKSYDLAEMESIVKEMFVGTTDPDSNTVKLKNFMASHR